jgi:hypothetical protein
MRLGVDERFSPSSFPTGSVENAQFGDDAVTVELEGCANCQFSVDILERLLP